MSTVDQDRPLRCRGLETATNVSVASPASDDTCQSARQNMKEGARELDPRRSGLYRRYHVLVTYLLEDRRLSIDRLLLEPADRETIERAVLRLTN